MTRIMNCFVIPKRLLGAALLALLIALAAGSAIAQLPPQTQDDSRCVTGQEPSCTSRDTNPSSMRLPPTINDRLSRPLQVETPEERPPGEPPYQNPPRRKQPTRPTEFEQMVADSVGRRLPIFGSSLFDNAPTTFAPVSQTPVPANYVVGPGDEIDVRVWGPADIRVRTTVDRNGLIYIPQVGSISVAGVQYSELERRLREQVGRTYRNFQLSASLGRLRTVQVFVVGEAAFPGQYTISALSTMVNAIFASGGPTSNGSLRHIQLRRGAQVVTELDLYDLLVKGDKSKDVPIEPGDVIYYPPASGFVAVAGSVGVPAIYELLDGQTVSQLLQTAGGPTVIANDERVSIERIDEKHARSVVEISSAEAKNSAVRKGDIIRVMSLVPRFDNTVTLRGQVANPGRYSWKPGMTVRDLIPEPQSLLTRRFWLDQAGLTTGRETEYPTPPEPERTRQDRRTRDYSTPAVGTQNRQNTEPSSRPDTTTTEGNETVPQALGQTAPVRHESREGESEFNSNQRQTQPRPTTAGQFAPTGEELVSDLRKAAPQINWAYALIERVNPVDLSTQLISFDLGKALIDKDPNANVSLQSGDIITIFSQEDVAVPQERRTKFVTIEGEVRTPGVYRIESGDNLRTIVARAGGLTDAAYLYGSQLTRVSVREQQQKSLDQFVSLLSAQIQQTSIATTNGNPDQANQIQARSAVQQDVIRSLRELRAPGRIVLQIPTNGRTLDDLPPISLEDGDRLVVPQRPAVVNVVGAVYNQGAFVAKPGGQVQTYFDLAGHGTRIADTGHMFIIRADGGVISSQRGGLWGGSLSKHQMYAGDTLVVPSKLEVGAFQRNLRDWTQILSQIGLTAASIAVIAK